MAVVGAGTAVVALAGWIGARARAAAGEREIDREEGSKEGKRNATQNATRRKKKRPQHVAFDFRLRRRRPRLAVVWQRKRSGSGSSSSSSGSGKCGGGGDQTAAQLHFVRESARLSDAQWYTTDMQFTKMLIT